MNLDLQKKIEEAINKRNMHIEMYAAAFVTEVGAANASNYQLVEERSRDGLKITWRFERKDEQL